jgi:hypothetical protein
MERFSAFRRNAHVGFASSSQTATAPHHPWPGGKPSQSLSPTLLQFQLRQEARPLPAKKCKARFDPEYPAFKRPQCLVFRARQHSKCFYQCWKSDNMSCVSSTLKYVISFAVVFGILYVLISPLPEMDATFSGKSALSFFILVTYAFLGLFFLTFLMRYRPTDNATTFHGNVLDLICVRLC